MRPKTVLIVDDVSFDRQLLAKSVTQMGYNFMLGASGQEGMAILREKREMVDVVLLDLHMPDVDGISALGHTRARHPDLPVIIITSCEDENNETQCRKLGVQGYLRKPLDYEQLQKAITFALAAKSA